jgi:Xaa-Pro aminopeptidase
MGAGSQTVHTSERLQKLRQLMAQEQVHAFVVPSEDQRTYLQRRNAPIPDLVNKDASEYLAECDERRAFISGFNGSAGPCHLARLF